MMSHGVRLCGAVWPHAGRTAPQTPEPWLLHSMCGGLRRRLGHQAPRYSSDQALEGSNRSLERSLVGITRIMHVALKHLCCYECQDRSLHILFDVMTNCWGEDAPHGDGADEADAGEDPYNLDEQPPSVEEPSVEEPPEPDQEPALEATDEHPGVPQLDQEPDFEATNEHPGVPQPDQDPDFQATNEHPGSLQLDLQLWAVHDQMEALEPLSYI